MPEHQQTDEEYFAEIEARNQAIAKQVAESPIHNVLGVVGAGVIAGTQEKDGQWTLLFTLVTWRISSGPMKKKPLSVRMTGSRKSFDSLMNRVEPYLVIRITARVAEQTIVGTSEAQGLKFRGSDNSDSELNAAAEELQKPVIYKDDQFGQCTLDRSINSYLAKTKWNGAITELNMTPDESGELDATLLVARELWNSQKDWARRIEDYAVQELLPLKNRSWLDKGEEKLTSKQFKAKMKLESITLESDGSFNFWHNDGDLFWGHYIQISGNLNDGPTHADIPG